MIKKVQTPQQHWKDLSNLSPVYFSILIFLYSSHPLTFVLSLWQSCYFTNISYCFTHLSLCFYSCNAFHFLLANFYSYPKVQFKSSILHAEHSRFPWAELEAWHSVLLGIYFCCSLFILKIICLHAYLSYFNKKSEIWYGEGKIFQRHYIFLNIAKIKTLCI